VQSVGNCLPTAAKAPAGRTKAAISTGKTVPKCPGLVPVIGHCEKLTSVSPNTICVTKYVDARSPAGRLNQLYREDDFKLCSVKLRANSVKLRVRLIVFHETAPKPATDPRPSCPPVGERAKRWLLGVAMHASLTAPHSNALVNRLTRLGRGSAMTMMQRHRPDGVAIGRTDTPSPATFGCPLIFGDQRA
jgi:hypothetical protein